jgi:hypothetical protein
MTLWRVVAVVMLWAVGAQAQDRVWVQIEALPNRADALAQAEAWAAAFPDVQGYDGAGGWQVIVLGPYDTAEGAARLSNLSRENLIPNDAYIVDGSTFGAQFWPVAQGATDGATVPEVTVQPLPDPGEVPEPVTDPVPPPAVDETPDQARDSEAALDRPAREDLQRALEWYGHYAGGIDGAFGRGTRAAMADWQTAAGLEPTGILTTLQRDTLVANWQADIAAFGFQQVNESAAGISITLPMGLVTFDHYEPPFVHYTATDGSDLRIILISQPGDQTGLYGLYDLLQTLDVVPPDGPRERRERSFSLAGANDRVASRAEVRLAQGLIKGWMLVWAPADADRAGRIAAVMDQTFEPVGDTALDPGLVPMTDAARTGLLAGLEMRKPRLSRSGFFVTAAGQVLTTTEAVADCRRITIERDTDATVTFRDDVLGIAVLTPATPVAAPAVAALQTTPDRVGSEIAVAGYPYEDTLPAPVLTFGVLTATTGLNGEGNLKRLEVATRAGDAGGPVVDGTGAVLGMLLPASTGTEVLPPGIAFARTAASIATALTTVGIAPVTAARTGALPPEDLATGAARITTIVGCWAE